MVELAKEILIERREATNLEPVKNHARNNTAISHDHHHHLSTTRTTTNAPAQWAPSGPS